MGIILIKHFFNLLISFWVLTIFTFVLAHFFPQGVSFIFEPLTDPSLAQDTPTNIIELTIQLSQSYYYYLNQIFSGQLGFSSVRGTSVFEEFFIYFPATLELSITAMIFALGLGLPLGIIAAKQKNLWQDKLIVSTTLFGYSMPIFWWAMLLVMLFSLLLGISPVASRIGFEYDIHPITGFMLIDTLLSKQPYATEAFYSALNHLILPSVVLGTVPLAIITRTTRSSMIDALAQDYIRSAKSRGLSLTRVLFKHAFRNAMIPILTILGLQVTLLLTGSLITETIFSWPGAGKWLLEAVYRRDFPVIHGGILAIASFVILTHLLLDLILTYVDPHLRRQQ
ncbi:MAG: ABC transporter permease subunit [Enterobacterales bacterium]|nr:ABC transporter permease subunit [Enterobacterales bacterium]